MKFTLFRKWGALLIGTAVLSWAGAAVLSSRWTARELRESFHRRLETSARHSADQLRAELLRHADFASSLSALDHFRSDEDRNSYLLSRLGAQSGVMAVSSYRLSGTTLQSEWRMFAPVRPGKTLLHLDDVVQRDQQALPDPQGLAQGREELLLGHGAHGEPWARLFIPIHGPAFPAGAAAAGSNLKIIVLELDASRLLKAIRAGTGAQGLILDRARRAIGTWEDSDERDDTAVSTERHADPAMELELPSTPGPFEFTAATGENVTASYRPVELAGAMAVVQAPSSAAFSEGGAFAAQMRNWMIAWAVLASVLAAAGCLWMLRPLLDSIRTLADSSRRVARGDFTVRVPTESRVEKFDRVMSLFGFRTRSEPDEAHDLCVEFNTMVKGLSEKNPLQATFEKFHTREIADMLVAGHIKLAGERREAIVLSSSVKGFAALNGQMEPEVFVDLLNDYMTRMVKVIRAHGGFVDKFVGHEIVALWGVPVSHPSDRAHALKACVAMREELVKINELRMFRGLAPIRIGMGLHSGMVLAGNMGSEDRREYTVIGDAVNEAIRLCSLTESHQVDLLVSRAIAHSVGPEANLMEKGEGFTTPGSQVVTEPVTITGISNPGIITSAQETAQTQGTATAHETSQMPEVVELHETPQMPEAVVELHETPQMPEAVQAHEAAHTPEAALEPEATVELAAEPIPFQLETRAPTHSEAEQPVSAPSPVATVVPASPPTEWYLSIAGQVVGPYATSFVQEGLQERRLTTKMKIGRTPTGPWQRIEEIDELMAQPASRSQAA